MSLLLILPNLLTPQVVLTKPSMQDVQVLIKSSLSEEQIRFLSQPVLDTEIGILSSPSLEARPLDLMVLLLNSSRVARRLLARQSLRRLKIFLLRASFCVR